MFVAQAQADQGQNDQADAGSAMDEVGFGTRIQPANHQRHHEGGARKGYADEQRCIVYHNREPQPERSGESVLITPFCPKSGYGVEASAPMVIEILPRSIQSRATGWC